MTKSELAKRLVDAAGEGTLLTDKHNPEKLSETYPKPRTVIASELAPKLPEFLHHLISKLLNTKIPSILTHPTIGKLPQQEALLMFLRRAFLHILQHRKVGVTV